MKQKQILLWGGVAVGGYLLYAWLKQNGYLDQWLGTAAPAPAATTAAPTPTTIINQYPSVFQQPNPGTAVATQSTTTVPAPVPPKVSAGDLKAKLLAATAQDPFFIHQGGQGTSDQWNYYRNMIYPPTLTGDQLAAAFPPAQYSGKLMSVDQFISGIQGAGLGDIVPARPVNSMSFGGGSGAFRGPWSGGKRPIA